VAQVFTFAERQEPLPLTVPFTVVARDPSVKDPDPSSQERLVLRTTLDVPASRLQPGPRGPRFHVVDFDASTHRLHPPATLTKGIHPAPGWAVEDRYTKAPDRTLLNDRRFRAQNVYAIAAHTLGVFESALGRPVPWAFDSPHLYLVPTAFVEPNAYYSPDDQALLFGYFQAESDDPIYTCLAHDIVAHETTHAILDGLRNRFDLPGLPDQAGFHEGFADIVALLSIMSARQSIAALIGDGRSTRVPASDLTVPALRRSVLLTMGKQFGDALHLRRGGGLRRSVELGPTTAWKDPTNREWQEPHRRGEILAAAVMRAFLHMWTNRLRPIIGEGSLDRERAAEEGASAAAHLLAMVIRAIDYCPPVEFEFDDFLTAVVASDREVAPNDELGYRTAVTEGFAEFGIEPSGAIERAPGSEERPVSRRYSYASLRSDPTEAFRFLWENSELLEGLELDYYLHVENVRPSVRVGPRGFVVSESIVDYVQELICTREELEALARLDDPGFAAPAEIPADTSLKIFGGGTMVFDEFGSPKYHHLKRLRDWDRQRRRLEYLVRSGLWDTKRRLGFSYGASLGQRFAQFHAPSAKAGEDW
jgi:hypothetical protein